MDCHATLIELFQSLGRGARLAVQGDCRRLVAWAVEEDGLVFLSVYLAAVTTIVTAFASVRTNKNAVLLPAAKGCH